MKTNAKIISVLLLISILILSFFGCGEYTPAINTPGGNNKPGTKPGLADQPTLDGDPTNDFTVKLRLNGAAYIPDVAVNVYWNDGYNIHIAPIDENGVATIDGLDGDYTVTLSAAPSGYSYDPNAYTATNDNRNIIIDMYDSGAVTSEGNSLWKAQTVTTTGVYTVTIDEDPMDENQDGKNVDVVYFDFIPQINGVYTIESWVNTADDDVNPVCLAYANSSIAYKNGEYRVTEVGACGSYTRNFVYTVKIANENISMNGSQCFAFGITAETKSGIYPATFTFAIKRDGDFDYNRPDKYTIAPKHDWSGFDFDAFEALAGGERVGAETLFPGSDSKVFAEYDYERDKHNYKVWERSEGGDGVYHVYDEEKYSSTGGYGPILFAYIDSPCAYLETSLTHIEDAGNNALTVSGGTENYRQFIKGFEWVAEGGFYCNFDCPCHKDESTLACLSGCTTCKPQCRPCPEELFGKEGYAQWCNSDGVVPVTPELKEFLQKFAISGSYFADGEGHVDREGIYAYEDSQWLFACGFYK